MLRAVVTDGTASLGDVEGYQVAGKTGTADKPKATGGYYHDKVINTFASMFPASDPKYVLIVTLDEPVRYMVGKCRSCRAKSPTWWLVTFETGFMRIQLVLNPVDVFCAA